MKDNNSDMVDNVIQDISPNDQMFSGHSPHYFSVGQSALRPIKFALDISNLDKSDIKKILDLPCGHGRVLRCLKAMFPNSKLTACDTNKDGVDFCHKTFGAIPVYSEEDVSKIAIKDKFDLIWCGSLLTHLNENKWPAFLQFFSSILSHQGIFVFTVHGREVANRMYSAKKDYGLTKSQTSDLLRDYKEKGFGYANYNSDENYGISLSSPSFVISQLEKSLNLRILMYLEKGWDGHQDVIACIQDEEIISTNKKVD